MYLLCILKFSVSLRALELLVTRCVFTKFIMVMGVEDVQARDLEDDINSV